MNVNLTGLVKICEAAGVTLRSAIPCISRLCEDGTVELDETHSSYPRARPGLGDYVANALSAIGVTKERVEAVVGGPCGCGERAAWLNEAGAKWLGMPPGSTAPSEIDPGTP
jgi:hypothetical protein